MITIILVVSLVILTVILLLSRRHTTNASHNEVGIELWRQKFDIMSDELETGSISNITNTDLMTFFVSYAKGSYSRSLAPDYISDFFQKLLDALNDQIATKRDILDKMQHMYKKRCLKSIATSAKYNRSAPKQQKSYVANTVRKLQTKVLATASKEVEAVAIFTIGILCFIGYYTGRTRSTLVSEENKKRIDLEIIRLERLKSEIADMEDDIKQLVYDRDTLIYNCEKVGIILLYNRLK